MTTRDINEFDIASGEPPVDGTAIIGIETAVKFARFGKMISAIKHIEKSNPGISREKAKMIVHSFGYGRELRWREQDPRPGQKGQTVRCL